MHAPLVVFATRFVGDAARAEELVQDVFFDVWRRHEEWNVHGSVRAYLYATVRNRALNVRRRDGVEQDWAADEAHESVRALHAQPVTPDHTLDVADMSTRLAEAMARLPSRCALMMQMRWHGGLSYAEIAESLSISVKGVENSLARGLKALRADLVADERG